MTLQNEMDKVFERDKLFGEVEVVSVKQEMLRYEVRLKCPICEINHILGFCKSVERNDESKEYSIKCVKAKFFSEHVLNCGESNKKH